MLLSFASFPSWYESQTGLIGVLDAAFWAFSSSRRRCSAFFASQPASRSANRARSAAVSRPSAA